MTTVQKLLPPAPNTAAYPAGGSFNLMRQWRESAAAQDALDANTKAAQEYLDWFKGSWLPNYTAGRAPWDANPKTPPVQKWALITESELDGGALGIDYELVDSPTGALVCQIPSFTRIPAPSPTKSLMQTLVDEGGKSGNPTIAVVPVNSTSTASDGSKWVRIG